MPGSDLGNGATTDLMTQIGQRSLDSPIPPTAVFFRPCELGLSYFCIEVPSGPKQTCNEVTKNLIDIKAEMEGIARGDINEAHV
jgi:hypothetical protein